MRISDWSSDVCSSDLRVAKKFMAGNGCDFAADKLVPTDVTDFSPLLLEIRNAKPDLVISNLAGNQITNFLKQYSEFGLPFPVAGFGFDTAVERKSVR